MHNKRPIDRVFSRNIIIGSSPPPYADFSASCTFFRSSAVGNEFFSTVSALFSLFLSNFSIPYWKKKYSYDRIYAKLKVFDGWRV